MEFMRLVNHSVKSTRWNTFYRVTSDNGKQYVISTLVQGNSASDWACGCLGWINYHRDCKHIRQLKRILEDGADRIPTITPTKINKAIFDHAQDETGKSARSLTKYLLDEFAVIDLSD